MPLSDAVIEQLSRSLRDAHDLLGSRELMRLIAYAAHPFHYFILKDYELVSISQQVPSVNPQIAIKVFIPDSNKTETLEIENGYIPEILKTIAERLANHYQSNRNLEHLRPYYVQDFANKMGV